MVYKKTDWVSLIHKGVKPGLFSFQHFCSGGREQSSLLQKTERDDAESTDGTRSRAKLAPTEEST